MTFYVQTKYDGYTQMQLHCKRKVISANYFDNFDKFIRQWKKLLAHQIVR